MEYLFGNNDEDSLLCKSLESGFFSRGLFRFLRRTFISATITILVITLFKNMIWKTLGHACLLFDLTLTLTALQIFTLGIWMIIAFTIVAIILYQFKKARKIDENTFSAGIIFMLLWWSLYYITMMTNYFIGLSYTPVYQ